MVPATPPAHYAISVRGVIGDSLIGAFPGLTADTDGGDTVLRGLLADQSALHGVLSEIQALGLELLEVRRSSPPAGRRAGTTTENGRHI